MRLAAALAFVLLAMVYLFSWCLCRVAAMADEYMEDDQDGPNRAVRGGA